MKPCTPDYLAEAANIKRFDLLIDAPPLEVFEVVAGKDEDLWFPNFRGMSWLTPEKRCVGAQREYRVSGLTMVENFTVWEPGRRLCFYMSAMSIPYCSRFMEHYQLDEPSPGTTALTWRICFESSLLFRPVFPLVRLFFERDFNQAAANLERYFRGELIAAPGHLAALAQRPR